MSWKKVSLPDICEINVGKTPPREKSEYFGDGKKWVSIADMNGSIFISNTKEQVTVAGIKAANMKPVPANTVLFSFKLSVGKVCITKEPMYTNEAIAALPIKNPNELVPKFLYYALKAGNFFHLGERAAKGLTLNKAKLQQIKLLLPPLEAQQKIAAILDKADELRRKDQQLLAKYDELLQSIFYQMFGDPVKNEKGWEKKKVKDILIDIVAGSSYGGEEKLLNDDEFGVLKVSAVTWGFFNKNEFKAVKKHLINKNIVAPKKGDLLFSRANTRELVGATCIVDDDYPNLFLPDKLWRVELNLESCNQYYFHFLLSNPDFRQVLTKTATGTSGSMLNISMEKLKDLEVPLPPIELQNQYGRIVSKVDFQKKLLKDQADKSETLFQSLLQKAFKGELIQ